MRLGLVLVSLFLTIQATPPQGGPCTEGAISEGNLPAADDAFAYMPPYGKPVVGKPTIQETNKARFSKRTNITRAWAGEHRIVATPSGDMAYEHGTMHVGYDEDGTHSEFDAVMLTVFKANAGVCQMVALTMQPLETGAKR